ncbi:hypothetical protein VTL71DRAFT_8868 [Oculimacula yallundae]|uniref:Uncharacterized protein n=1 Tax=Oculimacula yallundae TaxID=86028 RepID=A0ABR4BUC3_9HELO
MGQYSADCPMKRWLNGLVEDGSNIPIGLMFVGRRYDDARLVDAAYAYKKATEHRKAFQPILIASCELGQNGVDYTESLCYETEGVGVLD